LNSVRNNALCLRLSPSSMKDKAKAWLDNKTNVTIYDQMQKEFLQKFFSIGKLTAVRHAMISFSQNKDEHLHKSW